MTITNKTNPEKQRVFVKEFFCIFYKGFEGRAFREEIVKRIEMSDRKFRKVCAEIPEIMSSNKYGYWYLSDESSHLEIEKAREVIKEDQERLVSLYRRQRARKKILQALIEKQDPDLFTERL